ncbi:rifin [Plasmodium reichenowi]|uniref:Rifin n=1 Tax=Plasmodium reichenowi TaxID=5854 RepID=A0A060RQE8_PLARE|nr:rifin [Plasmodium reichenowi]
MKVHYINILLFALPLNILNHNQRNHKSTTQHKQTTRSLCECDLYMPNYDNDPEMKFVLENFNKQTQQRFEEYDNRMKTTRQKCRERCDKEIQKIILKDKLEKELMDKFATLHTDMQSDAIPTCVCEKSLADKTEKFCLNCGMNVGGGVTLSSGVLGGIGEAAISLLKPAAIIAAKESAEKAATAAATQAGVKKVISEINVWSQLFRTDEGVFNLTTIVNKTNFNCPTALLQRAKHLFGEACINKKTGDTSIFCNSTIYQGGVSKFNDFTKAGIDAYNVEFALQKEALEKTNLAAVNTGFESSISSINAAIIAIVVIVLIMVIIYKILRYRRKKKMKKKYRRKKKMKKKLQYIKLLEE